jgi:DNA-binding NarL/FixJ family response regulator
MDFSSLQDSNELRQSMQGKTRVIIFAPHMSVREMLAVVFAERPTLEVIGEASMGLQRVQICRRLVRNLVIFELIVSELCGIEMLPEFD